MVSEYLGRMSSATFIKFIACEAIHNSTLIMLMAQHKDCDLQSSIKAYLKLKIITLDLTSTNGAKCYVA